MLSTYLLLLVLLLPSTALRQNAIRLHWDQYDNVVQIQADGSVRVQEQQVLVVDQGPLNRMTRTFETGSAGQVANFRVLEDGQPYQPGNSNRGTFSAGDDGNTATIRLNFRDPAATRHTLTLEYTISRTLVERNNQAVFNWNFFWSGSTAPEIRNGSVEIRFPSQVNAASLRLNASGVPARQTSTSNSVRWELERAVQGEQLQVQTAFPRALLAANASFRAATTNPNPQPNVPSNPLPNQIGGQGSGLGSLVFCLFVLLLLFAAFSIMRAAAPSRRTRHYPPAAPGYGPDPFSGRTRRRWRRGGGGWWGGYGFPPIIIAPPTQPPPSSSPFDNTPFDDSLGGSGSSWGDSGGSGSSWGDSGGSSSSWGDSGGSSSSWSDIGGGGSSWGDSGGGGDSGSGGGSGGGSFG